jgi:hypothetical protein
LLQNKDVNHAIKSQSKVDWAEGQVTISDKNVNIKSNNYTKRLKLFICTTLHLFFLFLILNGMVSI